MTSMKLSEAAGVLQAQQVGVDKWFSAVSTDTRQLAPGDLFVALQGPSFDGHAFLGEAAARGAAGAIVSQESEAALPQLCVRDTLVALTDLAREWRRRHPVPAVAVTGSNGKTTVKEMAAAILSQHGVVLSTQGNFNNHIGVPLTLLRLDTVHTCAVVEIGASGPGEIAPLSDITSPGVAVITNAAAAHLEGFGDVQGVARAKGEIFSGLQSGGVAVINADDKFAAYWRSLVRNDCRVMSFGLAADADVTLQGELRISLADERFSTNFMLRCPDGTVSIELQLVGRHNVCNALAAAAAALACGATLADVQAGLQSVQPVPGRLQPVSTSAGAVLINDTYNANPASLAAATEVLAACPGEHWLVLGEMAELGTTAAELHAQAGRDARCHGVQRLFACGEMAAHAVQAFGDGAEFFPTQAALIKRVAAELRAGVVVLVKGSRSQYMERVVAALTGNDLETAPGGLH